MHPQIAIRPPRIIAAGGPVPRAIRAMRTDVLLPDFMARKDICGGTSEERAVIRALRDAIADRIEADIALLDALSGDPDLEPSHGSLAPGILDETEEGGDDEPSLGWTPGQYLGVEYCGTDDRELDASDHEPSLCGLTAQWPGGSFDDREHDAGDDREAENEHGGDIQDEPHDEDTDTEPSLCGLTVAWPSHDGTDRERDEAEHGIADAGGLDEQLQRFIAMGGNSDLAARLAR